MSLVEFPQTKSFEKILCTNALSRNCFMDWRDGSAIKNYNQNIKNYYAAIVH